jgi:hypothetical protein
VTLGSLRQKRPQRPLQRKACADLHCHAGSGSCTRRRRRRRAPWRNRKYLTTNTCLWSRFGKIVLLGGKVKDRRTSITGPLTQRMSCSGGKPPMRGGRYMRSDGATRLSAKLCQHPLTWGNDTATSDAHPNGDGMPNTARQREPSPYPAKCGKSRYGTSPRHNRRALGLPCRRQAPTAQLQELVASCSPPLELRADKSASTIMPT